MHDANYLVDVKISILHSVQKFDRNDFLPGRCFPRREPESRAKTIWIKRFPRWMYRRLYKYARANTCSGFCRRATRSELNTPSAKGNTCSCFCCSTAAFRSPRPSSNSFYRSLFLFFFLYFFRPSFRLSLVNWYRDTHARLLLARCAIPRRF